jgi:hypothetical protein
MKLLSVADKEQLEASRQELQVNHPDYVDGDDFCDVAEMLRLLDHKDARIAQLESEPDEATVRAAIKAYWDNQGDGLDQGEIFRRVLLAARKLADAGAKQ